MKVILKEVNTSELNEFIKQFKGFSSSLYLEIGPNYFRSRISTLDRSKIRFASITHDEVVSEMNKEVEFRAGFYGLSRVMEALSFEDKVDLHFDVHEENEVLIAKKMKVIGNSVKLNVPCMEYDWNLKHVYLSDQILDVVLSMHDPVNFDMNADDVRNLKKLAKFLGDETFCIKTNSEGVKVIFSDAEVKLSDIPQRELMTHFSCSSLSELGTGLNYNCSLSNNLISRETTKDTITIFAQDIVD